MIRLSRLDGSIVYVNIDNVVLIEEAAGAILKLQGGETMRVLESAEHVVELAHRQRAGLPAVHAVTGAAVGGGAGNDAANDQANDAAPGPGFPARDPLPGRC